MKGECMKCYTASDDCVFVDYGDERFKVRLTLCWQCAMPLIARDYARWEGQRFLNLDDATFPLEDFLQDRQP